MCPNSIRLYQRMISDVLFEETTVGANTVRVIPVDGERFGLVCFTNDTITLGSIEPGGLIRTLFTFGTGGLFVPNAITMEQIGPIIQERLAIFIGNAGARYKLCSIKLDKDFQ